MLLFRPLVHHHEKESYLQQYCPSPTQPDILTFKQIRKKTCSLSSGSGDTSKDTSIGTVPRSMTIFVCLELPLATKKLDKQFVSKKL